MKKILLLFSFTQLVCCNPPSPYDLNYRDVLVRIAELEIEPKYLSEYLAILREESRTSVEREAGVICIFPMQIKENPTSVRLIKIYASEEAYRTHLQTPHFRHYKTATQHMVRSLKLVTVEALDTAAMPLIFKKLCQAQTR